MIALITIIAAILFLLWLIFTIIYLMEGKLSGPKIKFKSFIRFYMVNPDRWDLYDDYVLCKTDKGLLSSELFHFGYFDWFRYILWLHNTNKREQQIKNAKATANMLSMVKKDIEKNEEQAKAAVNKGINDLQYVLKNERNNRP